AAQVVVVHAGKVVVDERLSVNALDGAGVRQSGRAFSAAHFGDGKTKNRPETFAASEETVAHRFVKGGWRHGRFREKAIEGAVDFFLSADQITLQLHG